MLPVLFSPVRLVWGCKHVVVVTDDGSLGLVFQTLQRDLLIERGVSSQPRSAQEEHAIRQFQIDWDKHPKTVVHVRLRHFHVHDYIAIRPGVEGCADLVRG